MDKSRVEPTIFFIEIISFSLKLLSGHFYGQSFIKTVRGPFGHQINSDMFANSDNPDETAFHCLLSLLFIPIIKT